VRVPRSSSSCSCPRAPCSRCCVRRWSQRAHPCDRHRPGGRSWWLVRAWWTSSRLQCRSAGSSRHHGECSPSTRVRQDQPCVITWLFLGPSPTGGQCRRLRRRRRRVSGLHACSTPTSRLAQRRFTADDLIGFAKTAGITAAPRPRSSSACATDVRRMGQGGALAFDSRGCAAPDVMTTHRGRRPSILRDRVQGAARRRGAERVAPPGHDVLVSASSPPAGGAAQPRPFPRCGLPLAIILGVVVRGLARMSAAVALAGGRPGEVSDMRCGGCRSGSSGDASTSRHHTRALLRAPVGTVAGVRRLGGGTRHLGGQRDGSLARGSPAGARHPAAGHGRALSPVIALAQANGRWAILQPGALRAPDHAAVGPADRPGPPPPPPPPPAGYEQLATYHPTFLYDRWGASGSH